MLSLTKLLIIALIIFAIFGAGKLPKVMGDLGKGLRALKDGVNGEDYEAAEERRRQEKQVAQMRDVSTPEAERAAPPTIDHEPRA